MSKILCIGEALIDMICIDKGRALSEGENFLKKPGGAPTNVAAAIAALGGDVELSAKVGVDPFGKHMVDVMKDFDIRMMQTTIGQRVAYREAPTNGLGVVESKDPKAKEEMIRFTEELENILAAALQ